MGTNYYLHKKANYIPRKDRGEEWYKEWYYYFFDNEENKVQELTNGFVFANTYYPTKEVSNKYYNKDEKTYSIETDIISLREMFGKDN